MKLDKRVEDVAILKEEKSQRFKKKNDLSEQVKYRVYEQDDVN